MRYVRHLSLYAPRAALSLALALGAAEGVDAQGCGTDWDRPFACSLEVYSVSSGGRPRTLSDRSQLTLIPGHRLEIGVTARDQWNRAFPEDRLGARIEPERHCDKLVSVEALRNGRYELVAGTMHGVCRLLVWVPGNMNLESTLQVEVGRIARQGGYSRSEAELVVDRLYNAVLGRNAEPAGRTASITEIQRGGLRSVVGAMFTSREFFTQRMNLPAETMLDQLYRGLLGRAPDSAGVRAFLSALEQRRYVDVVMEILESEEFEGQLLEATSADR